ncbi:MAG: hypothetical protein H0T62_06790 [Parachlamydiaceae bacterium]|nr:hypothetical protein [Parachlamydiaceae bacterium]
MLPTHKKIIDICLIIAALPLLFCSFTSAENISPTATRHSENQIIFDSPVAKIYDVAPWLKPGLLNSTRIELKFGSYGVQVLTQDMFSASATRLSNLYSTREVEKITRTLAFTQYVAEIDDQLRVAHEEIVAGGSIGATLKKYGFELKKDLFFKGLVEDMPVQVQTLMHTKENSFATVIYNLSAKSERGYLPYCTIVEIYAPQFLTLEEIDLIYPELQREKTSQVDYIFNRMKDLINKL